MAAASQDLTWYYVILFVGIPAVFGGILQVVHKWSYGYLIQEEQHRQVREQEHKTRLRVMDVIAAGLLGLGGGAAVLLAAIWPNKFNMKSTDENKLYLVVLGVVAGFIGYRILPRVAQGLEERVKKSERVSHRALEDAEEAVKAAEKAQNLTYGISLVETKNYRRAEEIFLDLRKTYPLDELIYYKLSNMYKRQNDFNSAIAVTNKYIEDLRAANVESDKAYGALYNRACYTALKALSPPRDDVLLAKALDDLKRAIDLKPAFRQSARNDADFNELREERNPRFFEIVGQGVSGIDGE